MTRLPRLALAPAAWLAVLGTLSAVGYGAAVGLRGLSQSRDVFSFIALFGGLFGVYFGVLFVVRRLAPTTSKAALGQVLAWAVLFRLLLLPAGLDPASLWRDLGTDLSSQAAGYRSFLLYDNDVWRYLWDGHLLASGVDPYAYTPLELEELADEEEPFAEALFAEVLWQDVYDNLSYTSYHTVYPPLAQALFGLLHALRPGSVFFLKLVLVAFDVGTCLVLARLLKVLSGRPQDVVVYAWNPLVMKEFAGSGHLDAMMIFLLVLALYLLVTGRRRSSLVVLGLSVLTKLSTVLLVGVFARRLAPRYWPLLPLVVALGYLPFSGSLSQVLEGLTAFSREWVFNPGPWALVEWISHQLGVAGRGGADLVSVLVGLGVLVYATVKDDGEERSLGPTAFLVLGTSLLMAAAVMPWYLLWVLPLAALTGNRAWLALTGLSLLSYLVYIDQTEHAWWRWVEYGCFFLLVAWERWGGKRLCPTQVTRAGG